MTQAFGQNEDMHLELTTAYFSQEVLPIIGSTNEGISPSFETEPDAINSDSSIDTAQNFIQLETSVKNFERTPSRIRKFGKTAKQAAEGIIITAEAAPFIGGPIRYGGFGAILAYTGSTVQSVAYLAGSTMLLESIASVSMADVLRRDKNRAIQLANKVLDKFIKPERKVTPLAEAVITNYLGVPILLAAKQRENPKRTFRENVRHGLFATTLLTGAIAIQGTAIAEGVTNFDDPKTIGAGAVVLAGMAYASKTAKNKLNKKVVS